MSRSALLFVLIVALLGFAAARQGALEASSDPAAPLAPRDPLRPGVPTVRDAGRDEGKDAKPLDINARPQSNALKLRPKGPWAPLEASPLTKYSFPYATGRHIVSDFQKQRIRLYDGATALKEWKMSSGAKGIGFVNEFPASPMGKFRVSMKVGNRQPLGTIIEKLTPEKRIGKESDKFAHMQTRILVLEGLDKENKNTRSRSIYIHGTNRENNLGNMASHGCFRMGNKEVMELFDSVNTGVEYFAIAAWAWPESSVPTGVIPPLPKAPAAAGAAIGAAGAAPASAGAAVGAAAAPRAAAAGAAIGAAAGKPAAKPVAPAPKK